MSNRRPTAADVFSAATTARERWISILEPNLHPDPAQCEGRNMNTFYAHKCPFVTVSYQGPKVEVPFWGDRFQFEGEYLVIERYERHMRPYKTRRIRWESILTAEFKYRSSKPTAAKTDR